MSLIDIVRLLVRHARTLIVVPLVMGATVFVLTRGQPPKYDAQATLYTGLVSGYEAGQTRRVDYRAVQSAFDNLIGTVEARSTLKTVALTMIAQRVAAPDSAAVPLRTDTRNQLRSLLSDSVYAAVSSRSVPAAKRVLRTALDTRPGFKKGVFSGKTPFSIPGIRGNLNVQRVGNSDLLEMHYTTTDPALCKQTLELLIAEVTRRRRERRQRQVRDVVQFFRNQVDAAEQTLDEQVEKLRNFGVENEIISYEEQTKALANARQRVAHDLQKARTRLTAAQSARKALEDRMGTNVAILQSNDALLRLRRRLSALSAEKALRGPEEGAAAEDASLQRRIDTLRRRLTNKVQRLHRLNHTPSGVANERILNQWLDEVLAATEAKARVDVLENRMASFRERYRTLAPLGSQLAGIRREVDIAENQYLELLSSLNQARMKHKMERQSSLRVVDAPIVPREPAPSNRGILIVGAAGAGGLMALAVVVALFLLDSTLRTPSRAEKETGLSLAGAYPVHPASPDDEEARTLDRIESILDAQLLRAVQVKEPAIGRSDAQPDVLLVSSPRRTEGKTYVVGRLCNELVEEEYRVQVLTPHGDDVPTASGVSTVRYDPDQPSSRFVHRIEDARQNTEQDVVIVETPALVERALPVGAAPHVSGVLLVARADRRWSRSDAHALQALRASLNLDPMLVLNGTSLDALDALVGEVPRKRSTLRRHLHRWIRLEFRSPLPFSS